MTKEKQKANKPLNPFVPLVLMVIACAIVSYFVIPGAYDRETVDGVTRVLADSYHATERTPVSFFNIFRSIPEGLTASANMMFCVMLIGGIVEIYKSDTSSLRIPVDPGLKFDLPKKISAVALTASILVTIYGILNLKWSYTEMAATFMIGGIVSAAINRVNLDDGINMVLDGARGAFSGALIIGVARAVQWTMTNGGLVDPLVHGLSNLMRSASAYVSTVGMFIVNFFVNALIPSGSGQATAVMPIMVPLADMLHITRQTAVLAFQFGDGISNTFWFTNGTLLIYLSLGKVPLKSWYKFILPLHGLFLILQLIFLFVAVQIGYGPF